jgi:hypothetical protein
MDHQNFAVSAALDTPLILNPRAFLTLDALIGALIFERTQDAALAMRAVPLAETNGIRHGSAAFLKGDVRSAPRGTAVFRSGLAPREASEPRFVWPSRKFKGRREYTAINPKAGAYRNTLDAYEALEAEQIVWFGRGDIAAVRDFLSELTHIGRKARQGYGKLVPGSLRIEPYEADRSIAWPLEDRAARPPVAVPMRPVDIDTWQAVGFGTEGLRLESAADRMPYFEARTQRLCVLPPTRRAWWADDAQRWLLLCSFQPSTDSLSE